MMAGSPTLFRYISGRFLGAFLVITAVMLGLAGLFDTLELMRRTSARDIPLSGVLSLAALHLPEFMQVLLPFGILFAAIFACWKLNKTSELVVIRAAGISAWQFLSPMIICALLAGMLATAVINPISATLLAKYNRTLTAYLGLNSDLVTVSRTGIWLRQPTPEGYALLHADGIDQKGWKLSNVIVFFFDKQDNFQNRIDSPIAFLKEGHWEIRDALINERNSSSKQALRKLPTELTPPKIEESFADPETISFWSIPDYIRIMEETGFPATSLHIHFQSLLAQPFLFVAMVLLAATFSLRPPRFGGTGGLIALGVAIGFIIFFLESMLHAFGTSQKIPAYLAAWTPAVVSLLLGATALLHLEDG